MKNKLILVSFLILLIGPSSYGFDDASEISREVREIANGRFKIHEIKYEEEIQSWVVLGRSGPELSVFYEFFKDLSKSLKFTKTSFSFIDPSATKESPIIILIKTSESKPLSKEQEKTALFLLREGEDFLKKIGYERKFKVPADETGSPKYTKEELLITIAKTDIESSLPMALDMYELDNRYYPSTEEGLKILLNKADPKYSQKPYLSKEETLIDPWGNKYLYKRYPDDDSFVYELLSWGPDGMAATGDDIVYKRPRRQREREVVLSEDVFQRVVDYLNGLFSRLKEGIIIRKVKSKNNKYVEITGVTESRESFYEVIDILIHSGLIEQNYLLRYETRRKRLWIDKDGHKRMYTNESSVEVVLNKKLSDFSFLDDVFKKIEDEFQKKSLLAIF